MLHRHIPIGHVLIRWLLPVLAIPALCPLVHAAPVLTLARPEDQPRFRVTTFASGLSFPTSMTELSDGSLLVAESVGSSFGDGTTGRLVRLVDSDHDGIADGVPQVLATGLPGAVTSVRRQGNLVVALSSQTGQEAITFWRTGPTASDTFSAAGRLRLSFPANFEHKSYALAVRTSPEDVEQVEVYFNVGAKVNDSSTPSTDTVGLSGVDVVFSPANVAADSVQRIVVRDTGSVINVSAPLQIASGLRNAAGMTFDSSGNLYLQDNGIDTPGNRNVSLSADELNRIDASSLGVTVPNFGFAGTYIDYATGETVGPTAGITAPIAAFRPLDGRRSEGAVELAMTPQAYPSDLAGGVFTGFFGMGTGGSANPENPVVFTDPATGNYFHFINNQLLGHPIGLLGTADSLFLADMSFTGSLWGTVGGVAANEAGVVYQIMAVPEPAGRVLIWSAGLVAAVVMGCRAIRAPTGSGSPRQASQRR